MEMQENHRITLNLNRKEYETFLKFLFKSGTAKLHANQKEFKFIDYYFPNDFTKEESEIFNDIVRMILKPVDSKEERRESIRFSHGKL